jgi:hypothetical protein
MNAKKPMANLDHGPFVNFYCFGNPAIQGIYNCKSNKDYLWLLAKGKKPILGFFLDPWLSALQLLGVWLYRHMLKKIYLDFFIQQI